MSKTELWNVESRLVFTGEKYGDWRDELQENGCVLLNGVIPPEKAAQYAQRQLDWLHKFDLGFDENDESTWAKDHLPVSFKGGMYNSYGCAHEKMCWDARTEPAIREDVRWSPWPHCDQNQHRKGMQAVQGLLNYAPNGPDDGGLMLMKGSSKYFDEFFAQKREAYAHEDAPPPEMEFIDLFLFNEADVKWFEEKGCKLTKVNMEPGDFVLWDSRTMHYAKLPEGNQIRHVQYICMTPRSFATDEALRLKTECFNKWIGTTHWPHCNINASFDPPMRGDQVCLKNRTEPFEKPELTDEILKLAGVKGY
ncbi:hypothetical protein NCS56_00343600 [Fusarium sp. Ph1]|nr:hypothetical protein NCS56_00343600 [Fusarium sp. Ph1]